MGNTNEVITIEDVHQLVDAKNRDPKIAPEDLYRQVDRVRPNNTKDMWKLLWIPLLLLISSVIGMLLLSENYLVVRSSLIVFVVSNLWGIYLLKTYDKIWWWIPILDVFVLYVIFAKSLSIEEMMKYITSLL